MYLSISNISKTVRFIILFVIVLFSFKVKAQLVDSIYIQKQWKANWIMLSNANANSYGVYYFRKNFDIKEIPKRFPIHVSADNRYKLFINGKLVSLGPARGDITHWNFETVDIAASLKIGHNVIAAQVWNEGSLKSEATISLQTAFILQGGNDETQSLNTNKSWVGIQDTSYSPIEISLPAYYIAGPGEFINQHKSIKGWLSDSCDLTHWKSVKIISPGYPKNKIGYGESSGWLLVPSQLPQMELKMQRLMKLSRSEGINIPASFPEKKNEITIPANTNATILLDQTFLTNAYPTISFRQGLNASITLSYAEALYSKYPFKGDRSILEGKILMGRKDSVLSDGNRFQQFTPLTFRTYRFIQVSIHTKEEPLVLEDIYGTFTGYPFQFNAKLETDNSEMTKMLEIGWRTARLCAMETYMDCPYYEQLQYIGDTRIQALVSLYNSGDDRLVRNALNLIDYSRQPEGLTLSRYPTSTPQYITPFSLWYVGMLHDYMMYGNDTLFVKNKLLGVRQIINYFKGFAQQDGSLKNLPWWNFTDWVDVKNWVFGTRSAGKDGYSALMDLQLLWAYELAADLEKSIGVPYYAALYQQNANQLKQTIRNKYWDKEKNLFADRTEKDLYSQHANALAILTGVASKSESVSIANKLLVDTSLAPASIYFKYYLHQSLIKAEKGNEYLNWLDKWRENIANGLTTWGETSNINTTRSDCHAWGASPNIEFFRTILGIDSDAPCFDKVIIEPHLGAIQKISGEIPHPKGKILVDYVLKNGNISANIILPSKVSGKFIWKGKSYIIKEGTNKFLL
jgi:hypothetical protein